MLVRGQVIANRYGLTSGKMDSAIGLMQDTLGQYACSATLPITASALESSPTLINKNRLQGLELAIHGLYHTDYSILTLEEQLNHFTRAMQIFQSLGIAATGFRCPYLRWNNDTLTALEKTGFRYDSSQALTWDVLGKIATDSYRRAIEFYGAHSISAHPALPEWSGNLIRIPYCLPDDEALVDRLQIDDGEEMADIWLAMLERAYETGELFTLGLHPERISVCKNALQAVLAKANALAPQVWVACLNEIVDWYCALGQSSCTLDFENGELYYIRISAPDKAAVLARSTEIIAAHQPGEASYQIVHSREFFLRSEKRPLIGLSPDTPLTLQRFLRHQGFLVEISAEAQNYPIFLNQPTFTSENIPSLLAYLEQDHGPIVRLARWPEAARCSLAISGDVDAFTIWDYVGRVLKNK
jgi:hypothetical protein